MTLSDNDESSNDDDGEQKLEEELFSVFYYNDLSNGVPEDLKKKYNISLTEHGINIALKESFETEKNLPIEREEREDGEIRDSDSDYELNPVEDTSSKDPDHYVETPVSRKGHNKCLGITSAIESEAELSSDISDDYILLPDENKLTPEKEKEVPVQSYATPKRKKKRKKPKAYSAPAAIVLSSDSDNESVEIIEPAVYCVKINSDDEVDTVSEDSYEEVSSDNLFINMSLPTYLEDVIEIDTSYDWKATHSPSTWTKSMKKFYNKPSKELVNFDCSKLIREMRKKKEEWYLSPRDLDYFGWNNRWAGNRCHRCHEFGHKVRHCPKDACCNMCGTFGHLVSQCPDKICLQCGAKRTDVFVVGCTKCSSQKKQQCSICEEFGHVDSICPDVWRRFHSTTKGEERPVEHKVVEGEESKKHCCNCAQEGHLYEECTLLRWSTYPVTKSHVTNYHGETRVTGEHKILLPSHIEEESSILDQLLTSYKKRGLVITRGKFEGVGLLKVSGRFGVVSHLRSRLMKVFPAPPTSRKKKKKSFKSKRRSKTEIIVLD